MGTVHPSRDRASRTTSDSGTEAVHTGTWATDHGHPAHVFTRTATVHTPDRTGGRIGSTAGESADTDYASVETESGRYPGAGCGTRTSPLGAGAAGTGTAGVETEFVPEWCPRISRLPIRPQVENKPRIAASRIGEAQPWAACRTVRLRSNNCPTRRPHSAQHAKKIRS